MWTEDPDGIRIVPVDVPASHSLRSDPTIGVTTGTMKYKPYNSEFPAVTRQQAGRPICGMSARFRTRL